MPQSFSELSCIDLLSVLVQLRLSAEDSKAPGWCPRLLGIVAKLIVQGVRARRFQPPHAGQEFLDEPGRTAHGPSWPDSGEVGTRLPIQPAGDALGGMPGNGID